jgi:hypothetical protein
MIFSALFIFTFLHVHLLLLGLFIGGLSTLTSPFIQKNTNANGVPEPGLMKKVS